MKRIIVILILGLSILPITSFAQSITKPDIVQFGETKANTMLALDKYCKIVNDRQISPIELPTASKSQSQVDCEKFVYAGKKRKAEFVFADGILDMVWILTDSTESQGFVDGFTALYGKPTHVKPDVVFFLNDGVAVRKVPHEVLFFDVRLKDYYRKWLEK